VRTWLCRYDKSKNEGRGDRADASRWPEVKGPVDIVLFEGWMSGFAPLPGEQVGAECLWMSRQRVRVFVNVCVYVCKCVCKYVHDARVHACPCL